MSGEKLDDYYNFDKNDNGNKCTNQQIKGQKYWHFLQITTIEIQQ